MTYQQAIYTLETASKRKKLYPIYLRLERLRLLFDELEIDPAMPSVHIAGTSGKGSTSSLCAEVLIKAGYKVGLQTSPHLQTPRERMMVNGHMPSEDTFCNLVETVTRVSNRLEIEKSYGAYNGQELLFTVTALYFTQMKVDVAVIETFMGGQYDPTNILLPLVSVITNVDLDHTHLLGKTVEAIATVKAGVIKKDVPFITGATQPSVINLFKKRAADVGTSCIVIGEDNKVHARQLGQKGSILSAQVLDSMFADIHLNLLGKHQVNNALLVLYIIQVLRSRGWLISDQAIREGFSSIFIPGRLEIIQEKPLVILDGAHNPAKAKALAQSLRRIFPRRRILFIFGMKKSKDIELTLKPLVPLASKFIVTKISSKKAQSPTKLAAKIKAAGLPVTTRIRPADALRIALNQATNDQIICITGSLNLVGELRGHWYPYSHTTLDESLNEPVTGSLVGEPLQQLVSEGRGNER